MHSNVAVSPEPNVTQPRGPVSPLDGLAMIVARLAMVVLTTLVGVGSVSAQSGVGFRLDLGHQELGRQWGGVLEGALDAEISALYGLDGVRLGVGVNWISLPVAQVSERSWHHGTGFVLLGYGRPIGRRIRPFGEVRYLFRTARPEGARLYDEEAAKEPIGPFRAKGRGVGTRLGVEIMLTQRAALSLSGERQWFSTEPDPVDQGLGPIRTGTSWRLGAGLTWFAEERTDDGQGRDDPSLGLAIGIGALEGLIVPWTWNEYVKGKPFTPVSPRSWLRGVANGFAWDDNNFEVNYFRHPYQGQIYFNAARANGYGFRRSFVHAALGSYLWECCTETHIASIPDMVTTVVGGAVWGETIHRASSRILEEPADGPERVFREMVAALLNPARGVTRLVTGRAWRLDSSDRDGEEGASSPRLLMGARSTADGTLGRRRSRAFLGIEWVEGDLFAADAGPFSYHRIRIGLHPGDRFMIGRVLVRGSLWQGETVEREGGASRFSAFVDADYVNTHAYRFAAHGVTGGWALKRPLAERTDLRLEAEASLVLMGSVDSEFAELAEIRGVRERLRLYDFGWGPGGRLAVSLTRDGDRWIDVAYRIVHLETLNGSNVAGSSSHHLLHLVGASARQGFAPGWGLGLDVDLFLQDSHYGAADLDDAFLRRSEARVYISWRPLTR